MVLNETVLYLTDFILLFFSKCVRLCVWYSISSTLAHSNNIYNIYMILMLWYDTREATHEKKKNLWINKKGAAHSYTHNTINSIQFSLRNNHLEKSQTDWMVDFRHRTNNTKKNVTFSTTTKLFHFHNCNYGGRKPYILQFIGINVSMYMRGLLFIKLYAKWELTYRLTVSNVKCRLSVYVSR